MTASAPRVAYLVRHFPVLSQTFVINEIADHLRAGLDVRVIVMRRGGAEAPRTSLDPIFAGRILDLALPEGRLAQLSALAAGVLRAPRHLATLRRAWAVASGEPFNFKRQVACLAMGLKPLLFRIDVIHCHFGDVGRLGAMALAALGTRAARMRLVTTLHGHDMTRYKYQPLARFYRRLIARGNVFLPVNGIWRKRLIEAGVSPERAIVHHMGVDTAVFLALRPPVNATPGRLRLAMVGRMVEKKGHRVAADALAILLRRRPDLDVALDIVGDGPLSNAIGEMVKQLGLQGRIRLLGACPHARALESIAAADAFVLPSLTAADGDMEGIPVALMEAMAMGRPVISTRHSGIPELIEDGRSGLLAEENDAEGIATNIERLADDLALREFLARGGRTRILADFDARALGHLLRSYYYRLLEQDRTETTHAALG